MTEEHKNRRVGAGDSTEDLTVVFTQMMAKLSKAHEENFRNAQAVVDNARPSSSQATPSGQEITEK